MAMNTVVGMVFAIVLGLELDEGLRLRKRRWDGLVCHKGVMDAPPPPLLFKIGLILFYLLLIYYYYCY